MCNLSPSYSSLFLHCQNKKLGLLRSTKCKLYANESVYVVVEIPQLFIKVYYVRKKISNSALVNHDLIRDWTIMT